VVRRSSRPIPWAPLVIGAICALLLACSTVVTPTPSGAPTTTPSPYADRIRIGMVSPFNRIGNQIGTSPFPLSNVIVRGSDLESEPVAHFLFRGLYRYDAVLTPIPDLAAEPCQTSPDLLQVTCRIGPATFSNGDPLTAMDVVFTYDLARSEACPFGQFSTCLKDTLAPVQLVDPATVRFTLRQPDPTFVTITLPTIWIDSKRLVDSQYATFRDAATALGAARLRAEGDRLDGALGGENPDCEGLAKEAEPLVTGAGLQLPARALWDIGPGRSFDACGWTGLLRDLLFGSADSLDNTGTEGEAIAYGILPLNWHPVGTGPWRIDEALGEPGKRLVLTASPTAQHQPATPRIEFVSYPTRRDAAEGLRLGEIDWLHVPPDFGGGVEQGGADLVHLVSGFPDVKFVQYADPAGFFELGINVRQGQLFADRNLRQALALCIDRRALVDAASDGQGTPAVSVIAPDVWAANPELEIPERNVSTAKRLIEASGWALANGVYQRAGKPLSAELWVSDGRPERVKFAELFSFQIADCGMDIKAHPADSGPMNQAIYGWPHIPPGEKRPFDLVVANALGLFDPSIPLSGFESENLTSKQDPFAFDFSGYVNPAFDALTRQARETYDTAKRARLYREATAILFEDVPDLPIWHRLERVALRSGLTTVSGRLELDKPGWDWIRDELVLPLAGQ
jgi:ABC-type transport system substrate-binding protein